MRVGRGLGGLVVAGAVVAAVAVGGSWGDLASEPLPESTPMSAPSVSVSVEPAATASSVPTVEVTRPPVKPVTTGEDREVATVSRVVDGDTVELADGRRVRVAGVDTPERGECGYGEAAVNLARLVEGSEVELVRGSRDDTDRYGRLIRYLDGPSGDAGLAQIEAGFATARYDSRDGYRKHDREAEYAAADRASEHMCADGVPTR